MCGKTAFSQKDIRPRCVFCFFSSRKEIVPLPFLSRKKRKQKKVECGKAFLRRFCCFRQRAAQNGRFTYEPSVFSFLVQDVRENRLFSERHPPPLCLLFLFFKKRNRSPILFFLERKGRKETQLRNSFPSPLLLLPPTCCTKRTVQMRTVRFSVPSRTCGKPPFLRKTPFPAVSFVSFLQEKKSFPFPFLFRKKGKKRKSIAEQLSFFAPAASANVLHKTDGSNANRPFFRSK